jgi:hypothetical protein
VSDWGCLIVPKKPHQKKLMRVRLGVLVAMLDVVLKIAMF